MAVREQTAFEELIEADLVGDRLWLYANYHCNLACEYCLTGSSPRSARRVLGAERMVRLADEAAALGFRRLGVTGGEPMLNAFMPEVALELASRLPLVLLTNGTLFTPRLLRRVAPFAEADIALQISLDSADPIENDTMRGPENFAKVVSAVEKLIDAGITVRIATTLDEQGPHDLARLQALVADLGVAADDHLVRPIIARGRAVAHGFGVHAGQPELFPELTITSDGAYWSPFGSTAAPGKPLDTEMLLTRQIEPLHKPLDVLVSQLRATPPSADALIGIR